MFSTRLRRVVWPIVYKRMNEHKAKGKTLRGMDASSLESTWALRIRSDRCHSGARFARSSTSTSIQPRPLTATSAPLSSPGSAERHGSSTQPCGMRPDGQLYIT
jgi:hypothetical protein